MSVWGSASRLSLFELVTDGYPEAYAVLDSTHTIDPGRYGLDDEEHEFGSAFSYSDGVFFGGDDSIGVFQLSLPLTVPTSLLEYWYRTSHACGLRRRHGVVGQGARPGFDWEWCGRLQLPLVRCFGSRAPTPAPVAARRLASTCAYYVDWGTCSVSSGALTVSGSLRLTGFASAECSTQWLSVLTRTIANALSVSDDAVTNVACGSRRRRLAASDSLS